MFNSKVYYEFYIKAKEAIKNESSFFIASSFCNYAAA